MQKLIVVALGLCSCVFEAKAQNVCDQLNVAVENGVKELSFYAMSGIFDDSAPRATNRKLSQVFQMGMIQANLQLLQANKCALPKLPVSEYSYKANALQCELAGSRASRQKESNAPLPECDRATWDRKYEMPK